MFALVLLATQLDPADLAHRACATSRFAEPPATAPRWRRAAIGAAALVAALLFAAAARRAARRSRAGAGARPWLLLVPVGG